jgi:hypothetical protein
LETTTLFGGVRLGHWGRQSLVTPIDWKLELREASGRPTDTRMLLDDLQGVSEATVRNNLTWLRKQGFIKKAGKAWKLTVTGRNAPRYAL